MVAPATRTRGRGETSTGSKGNRLSHYEHLPRPVRARRNRTSFTANPVPPAASSDVSSSLVSPANIINATPRPKSPREPRVMMTRPDLSAVHAASVRFNERETTAKVSNLRTEYFTQRSRSAPTKARARTPVQLEKRSKTPQPILAAEHFRSAMKNVPVIKNPQYPQKSQEGRCLGEPSWKTTDVTISGDSTTSATTPSSDISSPPRIHPRRRPRRSPSPPQARRHPSGTNRKNAPTRRESTTLLRGCIQGGLYGGTLVGSKLTECLYLGADIYQQECGPHQDRGGDRQFLYRRRNGSFQDDDDDIVEEDPSAFYSQYSGSRSKITTDTDDVLSENISRNSSNPRKRADSQSRSRSTSPASDEESECKTAKTPPTPFRSNRRSDTKDKDATPTRRTAAPKETTPTRAYRHHDSFAVAPHGIRYDQGEMPRLHTVRGKSPREESIPNTTTEFEQLRNYRLSMFEKDGQSNPPQRTVQGHSSQLDSLSQYAAAAPTRRLEPPVISPPPSDAPLEPAHSRTLSQEAPAGQPNGPAYPPWRRAPPEVTSATVSKEDEALRKELEETRKSLERVREDLQHAQELASRQQADTTTWASQLASEKLMVESKLQEESREKQELLDKIGKLQEETAQLKSTLQLAQKDARRSNNRKPPRSPSRPISPPSSTNSRGKSLGHFISPDRALADDMHEETSPVSSRDEEDPNEGGSVKRPYDSGAVLNLVREVVRGRNAPKTPPSKSPTSVMEETGEKTLDRTEGIGQSGELSTLQNTYGGDECPEPDTPYLSSRLISLRSELLEVRSQLAEAETARIKAETRRVEVEAINKEIQAETRKLREEVRELKELMLGFKMKESETERQYQTKVEMVQKELIQTKELATEKEKLKEKLEEELTETVNEADELRGQVTRFMKELERTKKENEEKLQISDLEAKKLQDELRLMKEKLSQTNSEIVQQASEHLQKRQEIEAELEQTKETAMALQRRVLFMDDHLSQVESETEHLRSQLASNDPRRSQGNSTWRKSLAGMADTISRSLSEGMGDAPIIIPEASHKDTRSSVIDRLRNSLDHSVVGKSS
eukprot:scaffold2767_cov177-Amphora_coffeaeformis.AAC.58